MFRRNNTAGSYRRISVTTKIALALSMLLLFVIAAAAISSYSRQHKMLSQEYEKKGREISATIALLANEYIATGQYDYLNTLVQKIKSYGNIEYIAITAADGKTLASAGTNPEPDATGNKSAYSFTTPIKPFGGSACGYVILKLNTHELDNLPLEMAVNWGLMALASLMASIFLAVVLTKRLLQQPLRELTAAIEHVAGGDFSSRVNIPRRDELGDVGDCFNNMSFQMGNLIQTVNLSIADIYKGMKQLAASLEAAEPSNTALPCNLTDDNVSIKGCSQVADSQEIHTLVKKMLRLTERLQALALQYKT